LQVGVIMESF